MASCPKCQTDLGDQDFGLIQCPGCGASLMIDLDGTVEASASGQSLVDRIDPVEAEVTAAEDTFAEFADEVTGGGEADRMLSDPDNWDTEGIDQNTLSRSYNAGEVASLGEQTNDVPSHTNLFDDPNVTQEDQADRQLEQDFSREKTDVTNDLFVAKEVEDSDVLDEHYDGTYKQGEEVYETGGAEEASVDEIEAFGNSDVSQSGSIHYTLRISHIDSREVREQVWEVLADKRLMLNVDELFLSIEDGALTLENLSAVKAYVVLNQLIGVAVSLDWSQHVEAQP